MKCADFCFVHYFTNFFNSLLFKFRKNRNPHSEGKNNFIHQKNMIEVMEFGIIIILLN